MKKAVILHGTLGSPEGNWFSWLETELQNLGLEVWLPKLPDAQQPSLKRWSKFVQDNCPFDMDSETIIIGHSSGAILSLVLAQESFRPIGAVVAISVFHDNSLNWDPNSQLFDVEFDFMSIRRQATRRLFIHSDDDPYVPFEQADYVAQNCQGEMILLPGQGHFNIEKSVEYTKFPKLLELLKERKIL